MEKTTQPRALCLHTKYSDDQIKKNEMGEACGTRDRTVFWCGDLRERDHVEELGVDG